MRHLGFSLLELLIVILIFGILLSFSYPSYHMYTLRAQRLEGQLALLDLATQMEHYYSQHQTYANASIGTQSEYDVLSSALTMHGYYQLTIQHANDQHFTIQALPQQTDERCQSLQITDQGIQTIVSSPFGSPLGTWEECWS
jgi:type IV pilus assembly protein PilE